MYALAASAAGVGMLALAEPAEAKIVYTPTHEKLIGNVPIDLNHGGKADMRFANLGGGRSGSYYSFLSARYANLSTTPEFVDTGKGFAVALHAGEQIGPPDSSDPREFSGTRRSSIPLLTTPPAQLGPASGPTEARD
jgi:hypothetical protein